MQNGEKVNPFKVPTFAKIGNSDYRFDIWYKVSDKSKIPFGSHVDEEEIEKCENVLFTYDFTKNEYFQEYIIEVLFFIDSRKYGCGGHVLAIPKISFDEDLQKRFEELLQRSADKIKDWGLEVNKEKLTKHIQTFENQKRDLDRSIDTIKHILKGEN